MMKYAALLATAALCTASTAPDSFILEMQTDVPVGDGKIVMNVTKSLAPIGVQHFWDLLEVKYYDNSAFYRVVPDFVVQYGIAGKAKLNDEYWYTTIKDDPVKASNVMGSVTYAMASAPNTRTTELFINTVDNTNLDKDGFAPFATVVTGMDVATAIYNPTPGNTDGIDQGEYAAMGNKWLEVNYPKCNFITKMTVTSAQNY